METIGLLNIIYPKLISYSLIFTRIYAVFYTFNVFRNSMATGKILVSLAVIMSLFIVLSDTTANSVNDIFSIKYIIHEVVQITIGICAGMILNIAFDTFSALGQIVSTQIGLSTASLFDPKYGMITTLSHFYIITATIIFLMMDGHLLVVEILFKSFQYLPVTWTITDFEGLKIFKFASIIINGSVEISLTLIVTILMTNICLAIMSKFAPQFNLFSVGMNMTIVIGLICAYICFNIIVDQSDGIIEKALEFYRSYFKLLGRS